MALKNRVYDLGIWALGFGFFVFYIPYSGLTKAVTKGLLGARGSVSGFEILPVSVIATVVCMLGFITLMGWWQYPRRVRVFGFNVPCPTRRTLLSGVCMGVIMATTTMAFSFGGASIVFMLVLLRAGVLVLGPIVDASLNRRVRWFSWTAMGICLAACAVALADVSNYTLGRVAVIDIAAYLAAYFIRLRLMTRLAKSDDWHNTLRYFVEEQMTAAPLLLLTLAMLASTGSGEIARGFQRGFAMLNGNASAALLVPVLLIGAFYAALCVCTTFIFLDRRENTFCIPVHSGVSLLSGIIASAALNYFYQLPPTSPAQYTSAGLIIIALVVLSPFHHLVEGLSRIRTGAQALSANFGARARVLSLNSPARTTTAFTEPRQFVLFVCSGNTCRSPMAEAIWNAELASRLGITLNAALAPATSTFVHALSAGVSARAGAPLTAEAGDALGALGVPAFFPGSRCLTPEMVEAAEAVYCMTRAHREAVLKMNPAAARKTWCLDPAGDIEDPVGAGAAIYARCANRIQSLVRSRLDEAQITA